MASSVMFNIGLMLSGHELTVTHKKSVIPFALIHFSRSAKMAEATAQDTLSYAKVVRSKSEEGDQHQQEPQSQQQPKQQPDKAEAAVKEEVVVGEGRDDMEFKTVTSKKDRAEKNKDKARLVSIEPRQIVSD